MRYFISLEIELIWRNDHLGRWVNEVNRKIDPANFDFSEVVSIMGNQQLLKIAGRQELVSRFLSTDVTKKKGVIIYTDGSINGERARVTTRRFPSQYPLGLIALFENSSYLVVRGGTLAVAADDPKGYQVAKRVYHSLVRLMH